MQYFVCTFWTRRSCVLTMCVEANWVIYWSMLMLTLCSKKMTSQHLLGENFTTREYVFVPSKREQFSLEQKLISYDKIISFFFFSEGLPDTDLLGRIGFEPLRSEIGDYGVHASQSDSIEATELLPLPIIIKRSITAPLRAQ